MTRSLVALAILALSAGAAAAAPGDPRVVQGTLEWPSTVTVEPFMVVRGEDGRLYSTDISTAQRRTPGPLTSGSRVAVLGVEGVRPHEITASAVGAGEAASLGLTSGTASSRSASIPSTVVMSSPSPETLWRVDGTVQSIAGSAITLRTTDRRTVSVDISGLSADTRMALRSGDRVALFGVSRRDRRLVANGFIQSDTGSPAASPSFTR